MRLTFLGTGTSGGVPSLGCSCAVCKSKNPRDKRMRSAALIETETTRILIDSDPDIRMQLMPFPFQKLDAVLLTHIHYDHVAGMDDLRPFCVFGDIHVYANEHTVKGLQQTMPYCFTPRLYPGVPKLNIHTIYPKVPIKINDMEILPVEVMHGALPILAFRIGDFAYITDMKTISEESFSQLKGVKTLVVNALRWEKVHHSHMLVDDAIAFSRRVGATHTYLTHLTHLIGFHDEANKRLPEGIEFAYDGLQLAL